MSSIIYCGKSRTEMLYFKLELKHFKLPTQTSSFCGVFPHCFVEVNVKQILKAYILSYSSPLPPLFSICITLQLKQATFGFILTLSCTSPLHKYPKGYAFSEVCYKGVILEILNLCSTVCLHSERFTSRTRLN